MEPRKQIGRLISARNVRLPNPMEIFMYKIDKRPFGFALTFGGFIQKDEMEKWNSESAMHLAIASARFGVLIDMRDLKPLPSDSQEIMVRGQKLYKDAGMQRSAVILNNVTTTMQFIRLAKASGIYTWERYFDASSDPNWEEKALKWIKSGIDVSLAA
jgi:hypothetical protein